jgi:hypothetical protein
MVLRMPDGHKFGYPNPVACPLRIIYRAIGIKKGFVVPASIASIILGR